MKNLYEILGIDPKASHEEVKRAYFVMAKKYHPDSGEQAALKKFYEVSEAYEVLSDKVQRKAYDFTLKTGKVESPLVEEVIHTSVAERRKRADDPDYAFRQKEKHRYRKQLFFKAIFHVVFISVIGGLVGFSLAVILGGTTLMGLGAGLVFGLFFSVNRSFDLKSFIRDKPQLQVAKFGSSFLMIVSVAYFVFLFVVQLLGAA